MSCMWQCSSKVCTPNVSTSEQQPYMRMAHAWDRKLPNKKNVWDDYPTTPMVIVNSMKPATSLSKLHITNHQVASRLFIYMENDGDDDDDDDGADVAPAA
ncbi:hypothetical protein J1N35_027877 [Gossypium stocksii]|uniref:Uncharacterized protein n=9 Tax=Gossypium TaxID=3633 RepID=A0A9D3VB60_9ROSI|nr:hypothetical protein J1N35_027877 [Gossypium stocksii]